MQAKVSTDRTFTSMNGITIFKFRYQNPLSQYLVNFSSIWNIDFHKIAEFEVMKIQDILQHIQIRFQSRPANQLLSFA